MTDLSNRPGSPTDTIPNTSLAAATAGVLAPASPGRASGRAPRTFWRDTFGSLKRAKGGVVGLGLIAIGLVAAIIGLVGVPESANRSVRGQRVNPPSAAHPFGTD